MSKHLPEHGGNLTWAKKYYQREHLIDFSANINPLGCPEGVYHALLNSYQDLMHYPDPDCTALKGSLEKYFELQADHILVGNGAVEIIYLICKLLQPRKVVTLAPTFSEYSRAARAVKAEISYCRLIEQADAFSLDMNKLQEHLEGADLLFLCNPNNPAGNILDQNCLTEVLQLCWRGKTFLVVDESFLDFVQNKEAYSIKKAIHANRQLLVLHSLTKFFAIPGLRLGCGLGNPALIDELSALKDPWNINCIAQTVGKIAVEDHQFQIKSREFINREREFLRAEINKIPLFHAFPSTANFLLLKILSKHLNASMVTNQLAEMGILVRNCNTFLGLGEGFIRVAVRTRAENKQLLEALHKLDNRQQEVYCD